MQHLTVQIKLTERKTSLHRFTSVVKNNGKEGLTFSIVRKEKLFTQVSRKELTERKLEKQELK